VGGLIEVESTHFIECVTSKLIESDLTPPGGEEFLVSDLPIRRPALVLAESAGASPKLRARRCACGYVACPPHNYGCERCGASCRESVDVQLIPSGVLTALTSVYVHAKLATPYAVGRVTLDAGPVLDVRLEDVSELAIGSRVLGGLFASTDAAGVEALDLHFGPEGHGS